MQSESIVMVLWFMQLWASPTGAPHLTQTKPVLSLALDTWGHPARPISRQDVMATIIDQFFGLWTMPVATYAESAFAFAGWSSSVWKGYDDAVTTVGKRFHYANCYMPPLDDKTSAAVFFFVATFSIQFPPIQCYINHNNFFQSDNEYD